MSRVVGRAAWTLLAMWCLAPSALAQDAAAIERREAAVGFIYPQAMVLGVLRRECKDLLPPEDGAEQVAKAWWERNRDELDASAWIVGQASARYRAEGTPQQAQVKERAMLQAFSSATLQMLRGQFARQVPTAQTCSKALAPYRLPEIDLRNAGQLASPMQATLQAFARSLDEARRDPAYRAPGDKFRELDAQVPVSSAALATLDAVEAAQARGDGGTVVRGYERLAMRGDATAAQSLGVVYLEGRWVSKAPQTAAAWFYNAWAMGEPEGLNALGVVWRDGLTGTAEPSLALAAFAAAMQSPRAGPQALQRAMTNLERLMAKATPPVILEAACIRPSSLDEKARAIASGAGVSLQPSPPSANDSPLLARYLASASRPVC
jgi:TPR repeat protein